MVSNVLTFLMMLTDNFFNYLETLIKLSYFLSKLFVITFAPHLQPDSLVAVADSSNRRLFSDYLVCRDFVEIYARTITRFQTLLTIDIYTDEF